MHLVAAATTFLGSRTTTTQKQHLGGAIRSDQEHKRPIKSINHRSGAMGSKFERSITKDLESAAPMKKDQEHTEAIRSIQHRSGAMASKIERSITEDLESAAPIKSDQKEKIESRA